MRDDRVVPFSLRLQYGSRGTESFPPCYTTGGRARSRHAGRHGPDRLGGERGTSRNYGLDRSSLARPQGTEQPTTCAVFILERRPFPPDVRPMKENFEAIQALVGNIGKVVAGKDEVIRLVVAALLARGHVLVEDKPGVGKTVLARALAGSIACSFKRIQCTPDLLPVDVTGYVDVRSGQFKQGPIFANIVLADELNRATPRTQSALLEPMGERQVSIDGVT